MEMLIIAVALYITYLVVDNFGRSKSAEVLAGAGTDLAKVVASGTSALAKNAELFEVESEYNLNRKVGKMVKKVQEDNVPISTIEDYRKLVALKSAQQSAESTED